jgi:signal transduction histidine kinase
VVSTPSADGTPEGEAISPTARPRGPWALRNWRVRSRLISLIAVPTVVALALGAVGVTSALGTAAAYGRSGTLATLARSVTATVADLQAEQAAAAAFVGAGRPEDRRYALTDARNRTDADAARVRRDAAEIDGAYAQTTRDRVRRAVFRLDALPALRSAVTTSLLPAAVATDRYAKAVTDLLAVDDEISQDSADPALSASVRALGALSRSKSALATQRSLLTAALLARDLPPGGLDSLNRAVADRASNEEQFRVAATVTQSQDLDDVVAGADVDQTSAILSQVTASGGAAVRDGGPSSEAWDAAVTGTVDKVRAVEAGLLDSIGARAGELRSGQVRQAWTAGIVAVAVLLIVLATTITVARSLVRPLRALRTGALAVARDRLPEIVSRLGRQDPESVDTEVAPIAVHSTDEIGEVARSFDEVHREAVRLAGAEARRRVQTSALFVNLSRRTQSLVDRQLALIDDLEQGEDDAGRLGSLFQLDHLATRMRRNGENLLVLGGQEPMRRWNRVMPLLDVIRAAVSEVEHYARVEVGEVPPLFVVEPAVSDLVHLLAELLENATAFSARSTRVRVEVTAVPGGSALVEIADHGIGLEVDQVAELNARLADPAEIDAEVSRRMGLYVVARLAARQDVRVRLRAGEHGGAVASVVLGGRVVTPGEPREPAPAEQEPPAGERSDGSWIGERWNRAVSTPGPGPDSWFGSAPLAAGGPAGGAAGGNPSRHTEPVPERSFTPSATVLTPIADGTTSAGLPQRRPGANEVPGAFPTGPAASNDPAVPAGPSVSRGPAARNGVEPADRPGPTRPDPTRSGPVPADPPAPLGAASSDRSPAAVRHRYAGYQQGRVRGRVEAVPRGGFAGSWAAATPVVTPTAAGTTPSGLPRRRPGDNYVPGALRAAPEPVGAGKPGPETPGPETDEHPTTGPAPAPTLGEAWDRSADAVRQRYAAQQQGRRRGMEAVRR